MRTGLLRIIDRAGVEPWPKLFHNLRASRESVAGSLEEIELETRGDRSVWEVEVKGLDGETELEIDAETGEILSSIFEAEDDGEEGEEGEDHDTEDHDEDHDNDGDEDDEDEDNDEDDEDDDG